MLFSKKLLFSKVSIAVVLVNISSCSQDTMIRINLTSTLNLLPTTEIRYKACGESIDSCQGILRSISQNIEKKKSELITIARTKFEVERSIKNQAVTQDREEKVDKCVMADLFANNRFNGDKTTVSQGFGGVVTIRTDYTEGYNRRENCKRITSNRALAMVPSFESQYQTNNFNPTAEDKKKIIKEASETNLNEYTFSKSDGLIVVICPTRYCVIASGDGGWIGIGERGKSIEAASVIK